MIDVKLLKKSFEEIVNELDFEKIYAYMVLTGWTYYYKSIPDIEELKKTCWELFWGCIDQYDKDGKERHSLSSGGFMVGIDKDYVSLYFIIEWGDNKFALSDIKISEGRN